MNGVVPYPEGWRVVTFGDVANCVNRTTRDPIADGLDHIVGLDHMDSKSLPLRRWDLLKDLPNGTSFTRTFRAGQVLFGKRRAYQRKVSVPEFDGVCSSDILVFEVSEPEMLQDFLPYIVQSEGFFQHALGTSAGSLSPRTKWQELAKYEFALPSLEEQERKVELLRLADGSADSIVACDAALNVMIDSYVSHAYARAVTSGEKLRRTADLGDLTMGRQKAPKYALGANPTPYLRVANVGHLELLMDQLEHMDFSEVEIERFHMKTGDIILTEGDIVSPLNVGRAAIYEGTQIPVCFQNTLIRLRPAPDIDSHFLMTMLEGARLAGVLAAAANTTTVSHLGLRRFANVHLPYVSQEEQVSIATGLRTLLNLRAALRPHQENTKAIAIRLRERLLNS